MLQLTSTANANFDFRERNFNSFSADIYTVVINDINNNLSGGFGMGNCVKLINSTAIAPQTVAINQNVLFTNDKIQSSKWGCQGCCRRIIEHENGSGQFTITQVGVYRVLFSSNVTATETGNAIIDIEVNGEPSLEGEIQEPITTANTYQHVITFVDVVVPCGTSKTVTIGNNSTIALQFQNANVDIQKIA